MKLLTEGGIKFKKAPASLFLMLDLTDIAPTAEEEKKLWLDLIDRFNIHILPGANGFRYKYPGWFRLCFSHEESKLIEGCTRLVNAVKTIKSEHSK
ncbi:hypothetical protein TVAG_306550 [Trichomonas vaginalis G3]|uniref:Aminotransferase class I/classII large domain-containing protein n=1 Tax=Trichomonas vaginalis (strain ATCC PRA-98 / G3) TaxID=412133 RepID=A2DNE5_TRIV3|nr:1-aminocyclopropane-1-carboxylate synthase protein [Trichomonas vaginalis G3]EAY18133.1 hypothetical protein TVAG_306550 [Trichomonas vaginalis G3]KAI5492410.1 1-aminocyclopropane-1-carboxylate synthase protein [Trichomonas vaginalis G3]|eukprot:XP_001579119.1 hypothetical protein [Trichomonas vaginalis G3]